MGYGPILLWGRLTDARQGVVEGAERVSHCRISCLLVLAGLIVPTVGISRPAAAVPIEWPGTGHWYELFADPIGWSVAKRFAESQEHIGLSGYLVTVTSQAENDFLCTILDSLVENPDHDFDSACWLGGYQPAGSTEPGGGWQWVTGEPWGFTNWNAGEPNDFGGSEDRLAMYTKYAEAGDPLGTWNDAPGDYRYVFVIEYSPEPATLLLLVLGGLAALRRGLP